MQIDTDQRIIIIYFDCEIYENDDNVYIVYNTYSNYTEDIEKKERSSKGKLLVWNDIIA